MKWTMVVAVPTVWMMQVAGNHVVGVGGVRNSGMAAVGSVFVAGVVTIAPVFRRAAVRICGAGGDNVLVHLPGTLLMMKMAVVQVVRMSVV
ncbi:MAG: hypothetical protein ACREMS_01650 [Gemmatimonadaceae bacterium]